jgi:hypothetical protein
MLLVSVALSALLATGAWWLLRDTSGVLAAEPLLELSVESGLEASLPAAGLPIPSAVVQQPPVNEQQQERVAPEAPPPLDFETRYDSWTLAQLREAEERLARELHQATQARFDELFGQFPLLLSQDAYDAHEFPSDDFLELRESIGLTSRLEPARSFCWNFRSVTTAEGLKQGRYLGFDPSEEATTAPLFAEGSWVSARILDFAAQD